MFASKPPTCTGRTLDLSRKDSDIRYLCHLGNSDIAENLEDGKFEKRSFLTGTLRGLLDKPAEVSRGIRARSLFMLPLYVWIAVFVGRSHDKQWSDSLDENMVLSPLVVLSALARSGGARHFVPRAQGAGIALAAPAVTSPPSVVEPERQTPRPDRLVGDHDPALSQQVLHITKAETETMVEPDGVTDNFRGKSVSAGAGRLARLRATLPLAAQLDNTAPTGVAYYGRCAATTRRPPADRS